MYLNSLMVGGVNENMRTQSNYKVQKWSITLTYEKGQNKEEYGFLPVLTYFSKLYCTVKRL